MGKTQRIGVTGNHRRWSPGWWAIRSVLRLCAAQPQRISVSHAASTAQLDALIVSGGDDISPEHYGGQLDAPVRADPARDELEIHWIKLALRENIPLLGICRGAQLINVVLGGNLHSDIRSMRKQTSNRPGLLPTKRVVLAQDSLIHSILGVDRLRVNSLHHQAIDQLGEGLRITGRDLDGFPQVVEGTGDTAVLGVQWHPEYLMYLPMQFAIFSWLVKTSGQRA